MSIVKLVRAGDKLLVKPPLAHPRFVAADQQDRRAVGIEGKSDSQDAILAVHSKLFHVRMLRAVERVGVRPPKPRAQQLHKLHLGDDFRLLGFAKAGEPLVEAYCCRYLPHQTMIAYRLYLSIALRLLGLAQLSGASLAIAMNIPKGVGDSGDPF